MRAAHATHNRMICNCGVRYGLARSRRPCSRSLSSPAEPFYGSPRPVSARYDDGSGKSTGLKAPTLPPLSPLQRIATFVHSSVTALSDPARADAVAAVGEVTGAFALSRIRAGMEGDATGRRILRDRPVVDEAVAERARLLLRQRRDGSSDSSVAFSNPVNSGRRRGVTFGAAYAHFLESHGFNPEERSPIRFVEDPDLAYVMTRYRQCHDYWHVLTGLPPTVLGELALKWLELMQTGLPLAALSATGGALGAASGLNSEERMALRTVYIPWALRVGAHMKSNALMCTYYEEELETDLDALRERLGIVPAPASRNLA